MRELRSYIVRIYRQGAHSLAGVVEDMRDGATRPFQSAGELWDLLRRQGVSSTRTPPARGGGPSDDDPA